MITEAQAIALEHLSVAFTELRAASLDKSMSNEEYQGITNICEHQIKVASFYLPEDEVRAFVNENYLDAGYTFPFKPQ